MSGLAEWCLINGHTVSGSDLSSSPVINRLTRLGAHVVNEHRAQNVEPADLIVHSTAIPPLNVERTAAAQLGIPVLSRGELLGELSRGMQTIAVCGSHGKSTTTALLGCALRTVWPATVYLGAKCLDFNSSVHVGSHQRLIAEVDESDGSFLSFRADMIVLTGLSNDHVGHYGNRETLYAAFERFLKTGSRLYLPVACIDEPDIQTFLHQRQINARTYGFSESAHVRASELQQTDGHCTFRLHAPGGQNHNESGHEVMVRIPVMGRHNVLNCLAAISAGLQLGCSLDDLLTPLHQFKGVEKRLEKICETADQRVYIDYAHNPQKIAAALDTLASVYGRSSVVCVFQPHRFTRLQSMWDDFLSCFSQSACVVVLPIYSAGEKPPTEDLQEKFRQALQSTQPDLKIHTANSPCALSDTLFDTIRPIGKNGKSDPASEVTVTVFVGAGDVSNWAHPFLDRLRQDKCSSGH